MLKPRLWVNCDCPVPGQLKPLIAGSVGHESALAVEATIVTMQVAVAVAVQVRSKLGP